MKWLLRCGWPVVMGKLKKINHPPTSIQAVGFVVFWFFLNHMLRHTHIYIYIYWLVSELVGNGPATDSSTTCKQQSHVECVANRGAPR